jgi:hypothetical protein
MKEGLDKILKHFRDQSERGWKPEDEGSEEDDHGGE